MGKRYHGRGRAKPVKVSVGRTSRCMCGCDESTIKGHRLTCGACGARLVITDGPERMHDSIMEYERSEVLLQLRREGHIRDLDFHPHVRDFPGRKQGYTADFRYIEDGRVIYEDVKGVVNADWRWIVALWQGVNCEWRAPGVLREVKRGRVRKWVEKDYLPKG